MRMGDVEAEAGGGQRREARGELVGRAPAGLAGVHVLEHEAGAKAPVLGRVLDDVGVHDDRVDLRGQPRERVDELGLGHPQVLGRRVHAEVVERQRRVALAQEGGEPRQLGLRQRRELGRERREGGRALGQRRPVATLLDEEAGRGADRMMDEQRMAIGEGGDGHHAGDGA